MGPHGNPGAPELRPDPARPQGSSIRRAAAGAHPDPGRDDPQPTSLCSGPNRLRERRAGSVILLAGNLPMICPGKHERVLRGSDLGNFTGGARPLLDEPG